MTVNAAHDAELARRVYGDRVVDKQLATQEVFDRLPRYVTEYLLAKYVRPGHEDGDILKIKENIRGRIPEADQKEIIKNRLMRDGHYFVIDQLEVEVDLKAGRHLAKLGCLDNEDIAINDSIVNRYEGLLAGGLWGTVTLAYNSSPAASIRVSVTDFDPFQVSGVDVDGYRAGRPHFSTDQWIRLMLRSSGYEPDLLPSERHRWLLLARLIPLVERNVNLIELGPRGTGKTFLLRSLSPSVFTVSGGRPTPASLFLHKITQRVGILGTRKVVVFDEIGDTTFPDKEVVSTLKDYMESGQFSRGKKRVVSDASIVLTGNLDVTGEQPSEVYTHLFEDLPVPLIDAAYLDRLHGYLPGWEIPKVGQGSLAKSAGFLTDYFGEVLKYLRDESVSRRFDAFDLGPGSTVRDVHGAKRIACGMFKVLYPDGRCTEEELRACMRFGVELRQRVHNQLTYIAPGEFTRRTIAFAGMPPHEARDLQATQKVQERDALANREPLIGQATGLVVLMGQGAVTGGDVCFVEVSLVPGRPGPSVTGLRGPVLQDSVKTAFQVIQQLDGRWKDAAARLGEGTTAVHLVNIADPKEGPSAGIAFVTAMVSAALALPVRAGLAMTGEISLHGHIGPVGGVVHKITAAAHHQRRTIIIPSQNAADLRDVPDEVLNRIKVITVDHISEVLEHALEATAPLPSIEPADGRCDAGTDAAAPAAELSPGAVHEDNRAACLSIPSLDVDPSGEAKISPAPSSP